MYVNCRSLWLPKAGRSAEEYEDAYWPRRDGRYPLEDGVRCAVADGATESSFAQRWARQLVITYCNPSTPGPADAAGFRAALDCQGASWVRHIYAKPLAWNFQVKAQRGAFATLLGITFTGCENGERRWDAVAVGDSCLFQARAGELICSWPQLASGDFGFHPQLLCSIAANNERVWAGLDGLTTSGTWAAGDLFLLMTDALAKWFVTAQENKHRPWETLKEVAASASFSGWIEERRAGQEMPNDDVTLMIISLEET
ncbi:MAG: protein phosphatase 2C domain-containing protein [Caldilineaceae bacterium]